MDLTLKKKNHLTKLEHFLKALLDTGYSMFYSVKKAVDMYADPEFIDGNMSCRTGDCKRRSHYSYD